MLKLLMVDDEPEILEILQMPFELAGYYDHRDSRGGGGDLIGLHSGRGE